MTTLDDLIEYFDNVEIPNEVRLSECANIVDVRKFIDHHIRTLKGNSGVYRFLPYYERLLKLKEIIEESQH